MSQLVDENPKIQEDWFDSFIHSVRTIQVQLETKTASKELKEYFDHVFAGNLDEMAKYSKVSSQIHFVRRIILDFLQLIDEEKLNKLCFDYNDSDVLVWAEIEDDREDLEKELILAEAEINAKYHNFGYTMNSTIVEDSDQYPVPNHYHPLKL